MRPEIARRPLRILIVNPSFSAGAFTHQFANALVDAGANVDVWTSPHFHVIGGPWTPARYGLRIRFYRWTQHRSWTVGPTRFLWRAARLAGHVISVLRLLAVAPSYDVVHIYFLAVPGLDALWLPMLRRLTHVAYHVHNLVPHDAAHTDALRRRWKGIYAACDVLFAHTEPTIRGLRDLGVPDARIVKVPLGEVASLFRPGMEADPTGLGLTSGGIPIVLMLGDVRRNKGVDLLLEAAALLKARNVSFRLLIAGRHPAGRPVEFEALAERLGIADLVEFRHLFIPEADMPAYMRAAAVVAFPYRAMDSQSAGAVWALSLGRPVVASRVGGLAELLEGCGCGRLIAEGSVEQLADALEALLRDPAEAERIGAAGARYARSALAWDRIATTTLTAYRGVPENSR